jgi:hypothetical protein
MKTTHTVFQNRRRPVARTLSVLLSLLAIVSIGRGSWGAAAGSMNISSASVSQSTVPMLTAVAADSTEAPMLEGSLQQIGKKEGRQSGGRIDGNLVSYMDLDDYLLETRIRYFDLATNTDHLIPSGYASSPSINGGRIAFHESFGPGGFQGVVFDSVSQTRIAVLPGVGLPVIGGNLVASINPKKDFYDYEIETYDLNTGATTRLTNDDLNDTNQQISPSGNAVVWNKCEGFGIISCDIYSAIQTSPGVFTIKALTGPDSEDEGPTTNGKIAAYIKKLNGETDFDVYFQPVEGGQETRIQIPLSQHEAKVAGNLIAFGSENLTTSGSFQLDIFVYDIRTGRLFRVTNTPVHEYIGDFNVSNGIGRIVFTRDEDIFTFTFLVPDSPAEQIDDLSDLIERFNLPPGTANSLTTKLQTALTAINAGDIATACDSLTSLINQCLAQSGKKLTPDQANQIISSANQIKTDLGCQ